MKIEMHERERSTLIAFADKYGLTMVITRFTCAPIRALSR